MKKKAAPKKAAPKKAAPKKVEVMPTHYKSKTKNKWVPLTNEDKLMIAELKKYNYQFKTISGKKSNYENSMVQLRKFGKLVREENEANETINRLRFAARQEKDPGKKKGLQNSIQTVQKILAAVKQQKRIQKTLI